MLTSLFAIARKSGLWALPESPRKSCPVASMKIPFGAGKMRWMRNPGIVDSIFSTDQIIGDQRPVHPGQHVVVQRVHFAKGGAHLSDLDDEIPRAAR